MKAIKNLGGTEFSENAQRWFKALCKNSGCTARYIEYNNDQWGRPFGHNARLEADSEEDLEKGIKILKSSGKFKWLPGSQISLATWIYNNPARVLRLDRAEKIAEMATKVQKYLHLSNQQWYVLANEGDLFIGEQVFTGQDESLNGPAKALLYIRMYSKEVRLFMLRCDGQGYAEEPAQRWGII